ncbi:MAG: 4'-phosphopantetheinyl transferase superfamily protein [Thermodesulfobacteriota bacterium]
MFPDALATPEADRSRSATRFFILPRLGGLGAVIFALCPDREGAREKLAIELIRSLVNLDPARYSALVDDRLELAADAWGRPRLIRGRQSGPSISFSHNQGLLRGAVIGRGGIGCDLVLPEEFKPPYPLARAFHTQELKNAGEFGLNLSSAAALIWSVKEAVVKALGTGFNLFDPLEIEVIQAQLVTGGFMFQARVQKAGDRVLLPAWADWKNQRWLALCATGSNSSIYMDRIMSTHGKFKVTECPWSR